MSLSNYMEDMLLDALFWKLIFEAPDKYVALWIGDPGEGGISGSEVTGTGYERVNAFGPTWSMSSSGIVTNLLPVTFPEAIGDWGDLTHFAIWDDSLGGNMILYGPLAISPTTIVAGSIPRFAAGTLVIQLD